jgi:hypothetical protein
MFTQKDPAALIWGQDFDCLATHRPTSGGTSEIEKNDPTDRPVGLRAASRAVTMATPVGK